jgi:thiosulfate/3-mercaptopyruvate sulfurtransferase
MPFSTLITCKELVQHLSDPDWVIVDCRFVLADSEAGRLAYLQAHIPGAGYAHLNEDLSGPVIAGKTGRHPLPEVETLSATLSQWGIDSTVQVIAYDDASGAMAATRLWWLLRWLGHMAVSVLDGGWQAWLKENYPLRQGKETPLPRTFIPQKAEGQKEAVSAAEIAVRLGQPSLLLFDSRTVERYRGEGESIDPIAGRIPGAISAPYSENLDSEGRFLPPEQLHMRFERLLGGAPAERAIFYCGSGVTATHNLLALAHAGLGEARLYAGSWSEWITDPRRPVARGK